MAAANCEGAVGVGGDGLMAPGGAGGGGAGGGAGVAATSSIWVDLA